MSTWYRERERSYGTQADVLACARIFNDVAEAMALAKPNVDEFHTRGAEAYTGEGADELQARLDPVPEAIRRLGLANGAVGMALTDFAAGLGDYRDDFIRLCRQGDDTALEIANTEAQLDQTVSRLRASEPDIEKLISWAYTYRDHPEVAPLRARLDELEGQLARLEVDFENNGESFEIAVETAVRLIHDADTVLYNNEWDKFWTQTLEPILEVVRVILEVAAVLLMIAAMIFSLGTLGPLILAVLLLAVSLTQVIGTAAAGHEVTKEMWMNLAMDTAAVVTLGLARYAQGARMAAAANQPQAKMTLQATKGRTLATQQGNLKRLEFFADRADRFARGAEIVEGGLGMGEGVMEIADGNVAGGLVEIAAGGLDMAGFDGKLGTALGDFANIGHNSVGAAGGISDLAGQSTPAAPSESSKNWPGLDGLSSPLEMPKDASVTPVTETGTPQ